MHIAVLMIALMTVADPAWAEAAKPVKLVVLGDSLSAGLGLPAQDAFPTKLQKALQAKGIAVEMTNAGVSGDTSSGGRDRLDWSVPDGTDGVIIELGANDALRGIDPDLTRTALTDIVQRLKARKIAVMLCGMLAPPNYGAEYAARFNSIYPDLAKNSTCRSIRSSSTVSRPTPSSTRPTAFIRPRPASTLSLTTSCPPWRHFCAT